MMHYDDYIKTVTKANKESFVRKLACSEACAMELRKRNYSINNSKQYVEFGKPLSFCDYIMGEFAHLYGAHTSKKRMIELFSDDSGLPIEQIERILSCQELLTVNTAKRINQAGVAFKIGVMMELQMREVIV